MLVDGEHRRTIWLSEKPGEEGCAVIIDQRHLPFKVSPSPEQLITWLKESQVDPWYIYIVQSPGGCCVPFQLPVCPPTESAVSLTLSLRHFALA